MAIRLQMATDDQEGLRRRALGDVVRERRLALGLTVPQLAVRSGVAAWGIEALERGERDAPPKQRPEHAAWAGLAQGLGWDFETLRTTINARIAELEHGP